MQRYEDISKNKNKIREKDQDHQNSHHTSNNRNSEKHNIREPNKHWTCYTNNNISATNHTSADEYSNCTIDTKLNTNDADKHKF